jgi:signal transduction histidine kinase
MRLSEFILQNMEAIVGRWEAFAATRLPAATHMKTLALRDHAQQILEAIAKDLTTSQTSYAQAEKSKGRAVVLSDAPQTAAETHAILRAQSGFDINQLASEYRALRASVLWLWTDAYQPDVTHFEDLIRFNEAIDQALAESIKFFDSKVEESRNLLLGMLGHDMRSPLQTIQVTASYLAALNAGKTISEAADRLIRSGARMRTLLDDLVDFNRTRLGLGIAINPSNVDLAGLFEGEVDRLRVASGRKIDLAVVGDARGVWDGARLQQALSNLILNALKYGTPDTPVRVTLSGDEAEVRLEVGNSGPVIELSSLEWIFEPLKRGVHTENRNESDGSLGLGLYIVREIAKAHGGDISARSDKTETVFSVRLPRRH